MKHLNKTIFTATLLTSFFLGQPVLAGEEAEHDEYSNHPATQPSSETHMHRVTKEISKEEHEANHKLLYGGKHREQSETHVKQETTYTQEEQEAIHKLLFSGPDK